MKILYPLLAVLLLAVPVSGKGPTVKITIAGTTLEAPAEVRDPEYFKVSDGAGAFVETVQAVR